MDNALWKGRLIIASEIAADYASEKKVRLASAHKELCCPDHDCQNPILRYCNGEKKNAFFAHLNNEHCDYANFDKENTQVMRTVRRAIFDHFKSNGTSVRTEVKLLDHHYTHLVVDIDNGKRLAIEIGTHRTTANRINSLIDEYQGKDIPVKWIVISDTDTIVRESQTYFIKRFLLNESNNKDLIVVSWDGRNIAQYKVDPDQYNYHGYTWISNKFPDAYAEFEPVEKLIFDNEELSLLGFGNRYSDWKNRKRIAFEEKVSGIIAENKRRADEIKKRSAEQSLIQQLSQNRPSWLTQASITNNSRNVTEARPSNNGSSSGRNVDITFLLDQQEEPAFDARGIRWVKCEKCGRVDKSDEFVLYGGSHHVNLGVCNNCSKGTKT